MFILTVEDEFLISEYLREILEGGGHEVVATFFADEAIEVLERVRDVQLVITDINMPGSMDGLRLAAAIRDRWPPIWFRDQRPQTKSTMLAIRALLRQSGWIAAGDFIFWLRWFNSLGREGSP